MGSKLPGVGGPAIELEANGTIEIRKHRPMIQKSS